MSNLLNMVEVVKGCRQDHKSLGHLHYMGAYLGSGETTYIVKPRFRYDKNLPDVLGCIIYAYPIISLAGRNAMLADTYGQIESQSERAKFINKHIRYIPRIIIDDRFRRKGLASLLLEKTLPLFDVRYIETQTPIDFTRFMFDRFNFKVKFMPTPKQYQPMIALLNRLGIPSDYWNQPDVVERRFMRQGKDEFQRSCKTLNAFCSKCKSKPGQHTVKEQIKRATMRFPYANTYLLRDRGF